MEHIILVADQPEEFPTVSLLIAQEAHRACVRLSFYHTQQNQGWHIFLHEQRFLGEELALHPS